MVFFRFVCETEIVAGGNLLFKLFLVYRILWQIIWLNVLNSLSTGKHIKNCKCIMLNSSLCFNKLDFFFQICMRNWNRCRRQSFVPIYPGHHWSMLESQQISRYQFEGLSKLGFDKIYAGFKWILRWTIAITFHSFGGKHDFNSNIFWIICFFPLFWKIS